MFLVLCQGCQSTQKPLSLQTKDEWQQILKTKNIFQKLLFQNIKVESLSEYLYIICIIMHISLFAYMLLLNIYLFSYRHIICNIIQNLFIARHKDFAAISNPSLLHVCSHVYYMCSYIFGLYWRTLICFCWEIRHPKFRKVINLAK